MNLTYFSKVYVCHHRSYKKVAKNDNKKGLSKNSECSASISITIKKNTASTRKKDSFVKVGILLHNYK